MIGNYVSIVTPEIDTDQRGRNPTLTGQHHDIYMFVKEHEGCSRREVTAGLALRSSSSTARIKELIDSGLIIENGTKVDRISRKSVRTLYAATDYLHKTPKDRVRINVYLIVDEEGNYHAHAKVDGGATLKPHHSSHVVMTKEVVVLAPYPNEYRSKFLKEDLEVVSPRDTLANAKLIIDG